MERMRERSSFHCTLKVSYRDLLPNATPGDYIVQIDCRHGTGNMQTVQLMETASVRSFRRDLISPWSHVSIVDIRNVSLLLAFTPINPWVKSEEPDQLSTMSRSRLPRRFANTT